MEGLEAMVGAARRAAEVAPEVMEGTPSLSLFSQEASPAMVAPAAEVAMVAPEGLAAMAVMGAMGVMESSSEDVG
jgi:hypothetical protein